MHMNGLKGLRIPSICRNAMGVRNQDVSMDGKSGLILKDFEAYFYRTRY